MSFPVFDFPILPEEQRTIQDKLFDVLMELDYLLERLQGVKNEVTEIWEELDE